MANPTTVKATTNSRPNSCVNVQCDCATFWSLAQQFANMRLCNRKAETGKSRLIDYYPARARRIAATYARMYLEIEEHGDPKKKGRYYWMALGAFASKTVACTLESLQLSHGRGVIDKVRDGLAQGNFWLFMDIAVWHWHYNFSPSTFYMCLGERDTSTYVDEVAAQMVKLPWHEQALSKINNLKVTPEVREGFEFVQKIENDNETMRPKDQLAHLMAMARHEQKNILQKLIYDDPDFAWWIKIQRDNDQELKDDGTWLLTRIFALPASIFSPALSINFTAQCDSDVKELKSIAPKKTVLENYDSRMKWIGDVAVKFHQRMTSNQNETENELRTIAGWVGHADSVVYLDESPSR